MSTPILVAGDTLVDMLPNKPGSIATVDSFEPKLGGSAANVSVALERLTVPPLFWTRIGNDGFGTFVADQLAETEIPDRFIIRDPDAKTTLAFVSNDSDGERQFDFYRTETADTRMESGIVPDDVLADCAWVHLTGVTLSVEPSRSATIDLAKRAREHECTVSLDPNVRLEMWSSAAEFERVFRQTLEYVDVVKASVEDLEVAGFEGTTPDALLKSVTECGPHTVFLTLGADGAIAYGTEASPIAGSYRHEGYSVDAVDTTGAGDGFLAGALASLVAGCSDPNRVLEIANGVGAVTTTQKGSVTALSGPRAVRSLVGPLPWENSER